MPHSPATLIHRDYWDDYLVEIKDSGDFRSLYFGSSTLQGRMSLSRPHELVLSYTQYMLMALLVHPNPQNILIIGIGSGSFVRFFHHHFPHCRIDAVDYSQHVINAARGYFLLPENSRITVHCKDGYQFLKKHNKYPYDIILVDAFNDLGMAPTIYSNKCFRLCAHNLSPNGVVSCNTWSSKSARLQEIRTMLASHLTGQLTLPVPERGNIIILSMPGEIPWSDICLKEKELKKQSQQFGFNVKKMVAAARKNNLTLPRRIASFMS